MNSEDEVLDGYGDRGASPLRPQGCPVAALAGRVGFENAWRTGIGWCLADIDKLCCTARMILSKGD